jgi:hypothetical protein
MLMLIRNRMRLERLVPSLARELLENRSMKVNCKHEGQLQSFKRAVSSSVSSLSM